MSRQLTDDEVQLASRLLSSERLSAFVGIAGTDRDAIELHNHTMMLASTLMPVTGMIEVVLRNAICERLNLTFEHSDWLKHPPFKWKTSEAGSIQTAARSAQRVAYSKLTRVEKRNLDTIAFPGVVPSGIGHKKRSNGRQKVITISTGQYIDQLTLSFWKRLFSPDYEETLWKRSLKGLFPNKALSRGEIANHLELIYRTRNRIAHHKPVMGAGCSRAVAAIEFFALNFNTKTPSEDGILAKLTAPYRTTLKQQAAALEAILTRLGESPRQ